AVVRVLPDRKRSRIRRSCIVEGSLPHREERTRLHASPHLVYRTCTVNLTARSRCYFSRLRVRLLTQHRPTKANTYCVRLHPRQTTLIVNGTSLTPLMWC